jgi:hypothetical protein
LADHEGVRSKAVVLSVAIASVAALEISLQSGALQNRPSDVTPFVAGVTSWDGVIQVLGRLEVRFRCE